MNLELLKKIANAVGDEDDSAGADKQKEQIQEENAKPEKKEKKKKSEGEKPENANNQAGPVSTEKPAPEAPPAGTEAVPAENGAVPPEGAVPAEGEVPVEGGAPATPAAPVGVSQVIDFLQANPNPDDASVHAFAEQNGMDPSQLETIIYGLSTKTVNLLRGGKSIDQQLDINSVDPQELEAGVAIEMEHTPDPAIAKKIALDHLAEIPDYYSRLKVMEDQAKSEAGAAAVPIKGGASEEVKEDQEETKEMDPNQPVGAQNRAENGTGY